MTFGNPFGLALYDKSQRQVSGDPAAMAANGAQNRGSNSNSPATQRPSAQPAAQAAAPQAPALAAAPHAPLDPPTIRSLQERIRSLLPPQLAAFSRAFQVPDSIPTVAGLITEQRHQRWIQTYLSGEHAQPA
ncbi:hypothetical protein NZK33_01370 [Cyanobium sp. FGCU-6]|nr:hypothetical protein [Cyanobium sp. FGCU6]